MKIRDLDTRDDLQLVTDSQNVESVKAHFGEIASEFDGFLVKVGDGDYIEVWGFEGIIPDLCKDVTLIYKANN